MKSLTSNEIEGTRPQRSTLKMWNYTVKRFVLDENKKLYLPINHFYQSNSLLSFINSIIRDCWKFVLILE